MSAHGPGVAGLLTTLRDRIYRLRLITMTATFVVLLIGAAAAFFDLPIAVRSVSANTTYFALSATAITLAVAAFGPRRETVRPRTVHPPTRGRWLALNSPATKVPSHGIRGYGQSYAVDLIHWPEGNGDPSEAASRKGLLPPEDFPSFGRPVLSMVDGTVVTASGWRRDHLSRTSTLAHLFLAVESPVRSLGGPGWIAGNHITVRTDDGCYAVVAHLRKGSLRVAPGDRVRAGEHIADCGNSGNSTEPHVHAQLMDRASMWLAEGLPIRFDPARFAPSGLLDTTTEPLFDGVPADGEFLLAPDGKN